MTRGQRLKPLTPKERRAHEAAEAILDFTGFRYETSRIPGLALVLMRFAEHEIALADAEAQLVAESAGILSSERSTDVSTAR